MPPGLSSTLDGHLHTMKLYADDPFRLACQLAGDLLLAAWVVGWLKIADVVHDSTLALGTPGRRLQAAGGGLASGLREAGSAVDDVPLVGDAVRSPFDGAGRAADLPVFLMASCLLLLGL